jgi:hypothetical protein
MIYSEWIDVRKKELDSRPLISFVYQVHMESFGRGRPRATSVVVRPEYYLSRP